MLFIEPELGITRRDPKGKLFLLHPTDGSLEEIALIFVHFSSWEYENFRNSAVQHALGHEFYKCVFLTTHVALNPVEFEQGSLENANELLDTFSHEIIDLLWCVGRYDTVLGAGLGTLTWFTKGVLSSPGPQCAIATWILELIIAHSMRTSAVISSICI